jgi:hypothetical protein
MSVGRAVRLSLLVGVASVVLAGIAGAAAGPPAGIHGQLEMRVVSSPPHLVSGGDARIEVAVPATVPLTDVTVELDGVDVTSAFGPDPEGNHQLEGVVSGLPNGRSTLRATIPGPGRAAPNRVELTLTNHPLEGPMFSGPRQTPFVCATPGNAANNGLPPIPQSETCSTPTVVSWIYRTTGGAWLPYDPAAPPPMASIAQTTTLDGLTVPMIVRWERGVINRFMYSIMLLSPSSQTMTPDLSAWNGKALYSFSGGVAIGRTQGAPSVNDMRHLTGLQLGYAVLYSTGTRTNTHYNLVLGGETAIMVKDRFVSAYAEPEYTVGIGASGGAIQQYVYGQNHDGLLDAAIPVYSYPDMVTQTIHIGDCELLERYMDQHVIANGVSSKWRTWTNRSLLEGLNASATFPNAYAPFMPYMPVPGNTECINGWRGLSPLALNPHFGTVPGYDPTVHGPVEWTHWADLVNIYGTDEHGFARSAWDNVGVQYGLRALRDGAITPAEFLDLNANVGSWKHPKDMVQEGCPFVSTNPAVCAVVGVDVWSSRNMRLSPDGGRTPAPRSEGSREAQYAAYRSGIVFRGDIDIPIIDWRHYLEHRLDMHNSHQSFASRQRMLNYDGDASNQSIWFVDARPGTAQFDPTRMSLEVMDQWMANIAAHPERGVAGNKPEAAADSCFATNGSLLARGEDVWAGILDDRPAGACTSRFPLYSTSRIVAGGPIEGGIFKCQLQPVARAIAQGVYGSWRPSRAERSRLEQIFPDGVCDYSKGDLGLPPELHARGR